MPHQSHRLPQQLDLFEPDPPHLPPGVPSWTDLSEGTRTTLTQLVRRMLIAHARGEAAGLEGDDDHA